jgi:hypothetical protein
MDAPRMNACPLLCPALPLLHQDEVIGARVARRNRPGAFD